MTAIFKVSDQENITSAFEHVEKSVMASNGDSGTKVAASLDDTALTNEMETVEKCASNGTNYAYNPEWSADQVSQLREYAAVVGMTGKMIAAKPASEKMQSKIADDAQMKQLSDIIAGNKPKVAAELSLAVGDPFRLAGASDAPSAKEDWQKVTPEKRLASAPSIESRSGGIMAIRGEYEFEASPTLRVRRGENSVADPDAISKLAQELDSGEKLRADIANQQTERKSAKTIWQKEAVQQAKNLGAGSLPRGKVFMTGSIPESAKTSGIDLQAATAELSRIEEISMPDLTAGEALSKIQAGRKAEIQRESKKDDWQQVKGTTRPGLSDDFAEALEHQLSNAGIKV